MPLACIETATVHGVDAVGIRVEADLGFGLPCFQVVGLGDSAVREARDRVRAAIKNSGFDPYPHRITMNLAPADLRKAGTAFDLPMALALLAGQGVIPAAAVDGLVCIGELGLDGGLRPVPGVLPMALFARDRKARGLLLPAANAREAAVVADCPVAAAATLGEAVAWLRGEAELPAAPLSPAREPAAGAPALDMADVRGHAGVKRALEVAAAGGHNVLMLGPPGAGKTMLAVRLPGILPLPTFAEALETTKIYSVAGLLPPDTDLLRRRPFRSPHHSVSDAGLIGGGSHPRPGEVSLAHNGILFLDELPEFRRSILELLRQPLEDGRVTLARAASRITYPARSMLVASMNPCPCGYAGDPRHPCHCAPPAVARYRARISGPLLDRIDIHMEVPTVPYAQLREAAPGTASAEIRERVVAARERQLTRLAPVGLHANAQMDARALRRFCPLDRAGHSLLERVVDRLGLSARAAARIVKLARTIADLEESDAIRSAHLAEAAQYRSLDRRAPAA